MSNQDRRKLSGEILFIKYLLERLKNGLSDGISSNEFSGFIRDMLENISNERECLFYVEDQDLKSIYNKITEKDGQLCGWGEVLKFKDDKVFATYNFCAWTSATGMEDYYQVRNFIDSYVKKTVENNKQGISVFNLDIVSKEVLNLSKQIAAYIVYDLMGRYISNQIEKNNWPSQCRHIEEYVIEKDLATIIRLDMTRKTVIDLYNHSVRVIADMIYHDEELQLSNSKGNPLAYSNFFKIIAPFLFLHCHIYNQYKMYNKSITIKLEKTEASSSEIQCVGSDPYGEWSDDYESKNKILSSEQYISFEKSISAYLK